MFGEHERRPAGEAVLLVIERVPVDHPAAPPVVQQRLRVVAGLGADQQGLHARGQGWKKGKKVDMRRIELKGRIEKDSIGERSLEKR